MGDSSQSSLRYLGPVSIAIFAVVVVIVIAVSLGGGGESGSQTADKQQNQQQQTRKRFYTVKNGDNLGTISEKTGVSIEQLQALNPKLDPQALIAGQRLKLR